MPISCGLINQRRVAADKRSVTYEEIFHLKFKKGCSTQALMKRFPKEAEKVREIALLQLPASILKMTISETALLDKLLSLKREFLGETEGAEKRSSYFPSRKTPIFLNFS